MFFITLDAGTTNLRVWLWDDKQEKLITSEKKPFGIRIGKELFCQKLEETVEAFLKDHKLKKEDCHLITSGMISSAKGYYEVPHQITPIAQEELSQHIETIDFLGTKLHIIPGLKSKTTNKEKLDFYDVLRGEEVEIVGITKSLDLDGHFFIVMPGSHNKIVEIREGGIIHHFSSTLSGELLSAMMENTILNQTVDGYPKEINHKFLAFGYDRAKEKGFTQASFQLRCLATDNTLDLSERFSYLLGVVLYEDIKILLLSHKNLANLPIYVLGSSLTAQALEFLIENKTDISAVTRIDSDMMSSKGALHLFNLSSKS